MINIIEKDHDNLFHLAQSGFSCFSHTPQPSLVDFQRIACLYPTKLSFFNRTNFSCLLACWHFFPFSLIKLLKSLNYGNVSPNCGQNGRKLRALFAFCFRLSMQRREEEKKVLVVTLRVRFTQKKKVFHFNREA
jgi:hypothetical protein